MVLVVLAVIMVLISSIYIILLFATPEKLSTVSTATTLYIRILNTALKSNFSIALHT